MANKYQKNQNNDKENNNKNQDTYRNNSELINKNGYMIYELNNTFNDKSKDVFNATANSKLNNKNENKKK